MVKVNRVARSFSGGLFGGLAGTAAIGGLTLATNRALDYADAIADASESTTFSAQRLQELKFQAEQNGLAFDQLTAGLGRFTKRLGLARAGTGAAAKTYEQLGIDLRQTNEQVFEQVVATFGQMENETNRLALATRIFGDDAQRLGVVFAGGTRDLRAYADRAAELGLILSDELVQGASDANDQLDIMQKIIGAQLTRGLVELAPIIIKVGNAFAEAAPKVTAFFNQFGDVEDLSVENLERRAVGAQREFARLQEQLQRRLEVDAAHRAGTPGRAGFDFGDLFLPQEDELRERIAVAEKVFDDAVSRIQQKNTELTNQSRPPSDPIAVDTEALFSGASVRRTRGLSEAQRERNRVLEEARRLTESLLTPQERYEAQLDRLTVLVRETGLGEETAARARARYTQELADATGVTERLRAAEQDRNRILAEGRALTESLLTPQERFLKQLERLDILLSAESIDTETLKRAAAAYREELDEAENAAKNAEGAAKDLGLTFSSAFEDAIVGGQDLRSVLDGLRQDISRIVVRRLVTEPLANAVSGFASGLNLSGFATGGSFMVGGSGGTDSQRVSFLASPNERVDVLTPAQQQAQRGSTVNVGDINIMLPAGSDEYMARAAAQGVRRGLREAQELGVGLA